MKSITWFMPRSNVWTALVMVRPGFDWRLCESRWICRSFRSFEWFGFMPQSFGRRILDLHHLNSVRIWSPRLVVYLFFQFGFPKCLFSSFGCGFIFVVPVIVVGSDLCRWLSSFRMVLLCWSANWLRKLWTPTLKQKKMVYNLV